MTEKESNQIAGEYLLFLKNKEFPCVGAKAALARQQVKSIVVDHMACPAWDKKILAFLYNFVDQYRLSADQFHSAAVIFKEPHIIDEPLFELLLWSRLQSLHDLDREKFSFDKRVNADPRANDFSFSLKEEAFFIIGLHPGSSRRSRQFTYPAMVFNPHQQFEKLKRQGRYDKIKSVVRNRDIQYSGTLNPMLDDFGHSSETRQYSGGNHPTEWSCPLNINYGRTKHNPTA